jgi:hypothetical protein
VGLTGGKQGDQGREKRIIPAGQMKKYFREL